MSSHRSTRLLALSLVATGGLLGLSAGPAAADGSGEFEGGFIYPQGSGAVVNDATAGGGAAAQLWGQGSSSDLYVSNATATTSYRIRARQNACGAAAAQMVVSVETVVVGTFTLGNTWADYTVTGNWPSGWRHLHVEFANAYQESSCRRSLLLDSAVAISGRTFYVDPAGDDGNDGTSPATAWATVGEVNGAALQAGDTVLFKRGATFHRAPLEADTAGVTYGAYGSGERPILDGGGGEKHTVDVTAPNVTVQDLQVQDAGDADKVGISVTRPDVLVQRVTATGNAIGVQADDGAHRLRVTDSILRDNETVIQPDGPRDDYGACGVSVLKADHVEIDNNTFTGNVGPSKDFVLDGSAVEIYGGTHTSVHHNEATDNHTFSELGNDATADTHFHNNLIVTTAAGPGKAYGINVQGAGEFGGVERTTVTNNTIVMRSDDPRPVSVGTGADVVLHNNIVSAVQVGFTQQPIDEGHNLYSENWYNGIKSLDSPGGTGISPSSRTADPLFLSATDFRLQPGSPAKNLGIDTYGVSTDLAGQPRRVGSGVDAGAYELQQP